MRALGPSDSMTANMRKDLAIAYRGLGDYGKAKAILAALADREKVAPDHLDIGKLQHNLGAVLWERETRSRERRVRRRRGTAAGRARPDHPHVATAREGLAVVHVALGDYAAARAGYERVLASREKSLGPGIPRSATRWPILATCWPRSGTTRRHARRSSVRSRSGSARCLARQPRS